MIAGRRQRVGAPVQRRMPVIVPRFAVPNNRREGRQHDIVAITTGVVDAECERIACPNGKILSLRQIIEEPHHRVRAVIMDDRKRIPLGRAEAVDQTDV